ncbi:MAG: FHA domain-containing protein [Lyngbya sp. HA4199-MV5]|nr:FHA domain-containing protein [Lyngbya sp. HA4199-MV5]
MTTGRTAFLTTNLPDNRATHVTSVGTSWLVGRSTNCAISINNASISRCHAVIGHCPDRGFYIMDVGSSNGTFVNCRRLAALEQRFLNDGDLVELSHTRMEFFISGYSNRQPAHQDTQV